MIIEGVAIGVMLVMKLFPKTPAAQALHRAFVEQPAAWTRRHLIFLCVMFAFIFSGNQLLMLAGPEFAMLLAWDSALALDAAIAAWTAATLGRLGAIQRQVMAKWRGLCGRQARPRSVRTRSKTPKAVNDDEPGLVALAA